MLYRFDLHLHSCLSPCGDLECAPSAVVEKAQSVGLNGLMLADHNTSKNAPACAEHCRRRGIACLFGMEVTSSEEVHALAVFDTVDQAAAMTEFVYAALPKRVNQPEIFGDQPVVNADDEIEELEWRLLSAPTRLPLKTIGEKIHELGGLFIPTHVDRPTFSVFSQLGGIAGDEGFDAVELSRFADPAEWKDKLRGLAIIRSSDAHYLENIGSIWTELELSGFNVAALKKAFASPGAPDTVSP